MKEKIQQQDLPLCKRKCLVWNGNKLLLNKKIIKLESDQLENRRRVPKCPRACSKKIKELVTKESALRDEGDTQHYASCKSILTNQLTNDLSTLASNIEIIKDNRTECFDLTLKNINVQITTNIPNEPGRIGCGSLHVGEKSMDSTIAHRRQVEKASGKRSHGESHGGSGAHNMRGGLGGTSDGDYSFLFGNGGYVDRASACASITGGNNAQILECGCDESCWTAGEGVNTSAIAATQDSLALMVVDVATNGDYLTKILGNLDIFDDQDNYNYGAGYFASTFKEIENDLKDIVNFLNVPTPFIDYASPSDYPPWETGLVEKLATIRGDLDGIATAAKLISDKLDLPNKQTDPKKVLYEDVIKYLLDTNGDLLCQSQELVGIQGTNTYSICNLTSGKATDATMNALCESEQAYAAIYGPSMKSQLLYHQNTFRREKWGTNYGTNEAAIGDLVELVECIRSDTLYAEKPLNTKDSSLILGWNGDDETECKYGRYCEGDYSQTSDFADLGDFTQWSP